jgi:GNAT superfamily N-acetyltransferase
MIGKFDTFNPETADIEMWNPLHPNKGRGFRCIRREFGTYFKQGRLAREVSAHIGRCWIAQHVDALAGYITLFADKLSLHTPLLEDEDIKYETFPAVKVGLLAVDERTSGLGRFLIEWAMYYVAAELNPMMGVRFLTIDALFDPDNEYDTSGFYEKLGFQFADRDEILGHDNFYRSMYIDLYDLIEQLS